MQTLAAAAIAHQNALYCYNNKINQHVKTIIKINFLVCSWSQLKIYINETVASFCKLMN